MKIVIQGGTITATAENKADAMKLIGLAYPSENKVALAHETKHRKKPVFKKPCPVCGGMYKKVALHVTKTHNKGVRTIPVTQG